MRKACKHANSLRILYGTRVRKSALASQTVTSHRPMRTPEVSSRLGGIMRLQTRRHFTYTHARHEVTRAYYSHRSPIQQAPNSCGVRTFLLEGRFYRHLQQGRCRSPSPPTSRTHAVPQGVRPPTRSGSRPYGPAVQEGAANTRTLAAEMPKPRCPPTTHLW